MALVGVRLGPFEPESRVGFSLITLDAFHSQWSFEMFSPRVEDARKALAHVGAFVQLHAPR